MPPSPANRAAEPHPNDDTAVPGVAAVPAVPGLAAKPGGGTPLLRQRLRGRFAALSVVGGVMVVLPLLQVLRYQNAEVLSLVTERAGLDPVARAVDVQRSLLLHRESAAAVLRGQVALEGERRLRQGEVDSSVGALAVALANGAWDRAIKESDALREDWSLLVRQVVQRSVNAQESDLAHRLLMEQTLQVIDLVAAATLPQPGATPLLAEVGDDTVPTLAAAHALPRLAWQLALLAAPDAEVGSATSASATSAPATPPVTPSVTLSATPSAMSSTTDTGRDIAAAEASVARALGAMNSAVDRQHIPAAQLALAHASAGAGAAADHYFSLLRQPARTQPAVADLQAAADSAVHAQLQLFDLARKIVDDRLGDQAAAAELRRTLFVSAMAVLALTALALISSLARRLQHWQRTALDLVADAARHRAPLPAPQADARRLLQRLRDGDECRRAQAAPRLDRPQQEAQPTLPSDL